MFLKHFILFFLILLVSTLVSFIYLGRPVIGIDDANISMNYAWHLSKGEGFVFNHGGEKVEGFTSMLWVLCISFFYLMTNDPEMIMMVFLLLLAAITATLIYREVSYDVKVINPEFQRKYLLWIFSGFLICIGPSYVVWSVLSLMENGLWNFLFTAAVVILLQMMRGLMDTERKLLLAVTCMLLTLTRPEAMLWCVLFGAVLFILAWKNRNSYVYPVVFITLILGIIAGLTLFRQNYFGYPLPNTYYAKVSGDLIYNLKEGLIYLTRFISNYNPLLTFLFVVLVISSVSGLLNLYRVYRTNIASGLSEPLLWRGVFVSVIILTSLILPLGTGGDHFAGFRFYQGSILLFIWGVPAVLNRNHFANTNVTARTSALVLGVTFFLFLAGTLYNMKNSPETRLNFEFTLASEGRSDADFLNDFWSERKPSVGLIVVGGFSLKYKGKTIDLMGLSNTIMGHSEGNRKGIKNHAAFNKEVFYALHPELVLPKIVDNEDQAKEHYLDLTETDNFSNKALKNILNDSVFFKVYEPVVLKKHDQVLFTFASKNLSKGITRDTSMLLIKLRL